MALRQDEHLIVAAQAGSSRAFVDLYRRHVTAVERVCRRYLRDPDDVEEAVQETFLRAFRALPGFNGDFRVQAWLVRIATNICWDIGRKKGRRPALVALPPGIDVEDAPVTLSVMEATGRVASILDKLRPEQALALRLATVEGLSHAEIGDRLGRSSAQVKALLFRARRNFQKFWDISSAGTILPSLGAFSAVTAAAYRVGVAPL